MRKARPWLIGASFLILAVSYAYQAAREADPAFRIADVILALLVASASVYLFFDVRRMQRRQAEANALMKEVREKSTEETERILEALRRVNDEKKA